MVHPVAPLLEVPELPARPLIVQKAQPSGAQQRRGLEVAHGARDVQVFSVAFDRRIHVPDALSLDCCLHAAAGRAVAIHLAPAVPLNNLRRLPSCNLEVADGLGEGAGTPEQGQRGMVPGTKNQYYVPGSEKTVHWG